MVTNGGRSLTGGVGRGGGLQMGGGESLMEVNGWECRGVIEGGGGISDWGVEGRGVTEVVIGESPRGRGMSH